MLQKFDCYDGLCFCGGLIFFAPVALLVRTRAGVSESLFFVFQALISVTIFLGEVPTGLLADRLGYKNTLILSQFTVLLARILLTAGFFLHSPVLFAVEAVVEGLACCFSSGSSDAYLYEVYGKERYLSKSAQAANWGTAGFILSTLSYLVLYGSFGIPGLLMATVAASFIASLCSLGLKKEDAAPVNQHPAQPSAPQLLSILRQREALELMALSAVFTVCAILINFFYVEKLMACGISAGWLSPIILVYSLIQMLARPILDRLERAPRQRTLGIACAVAAAALMVFGQTAGAVPVIALMLILPLLLSIPGFLVGELKNGFIDRFHRGENRAAGLSVMNMGVGLVEILALFASALLTGAGVGPCFLAAGTALLLLGTAFFFRK